MRIIVATATLGLAFVGLSVAADGQAAMKRVRTSIPPEALGPALRSLAKELNFQIVYASKDVGSLRTHGAVGDFTPEQALSKVLSGTGMKFKYLDPHTFTVLRMGVAETATAGARPNAAGISSQSEAKEGKRSTSDSFRLAQAGQGEAAEPASLSKQSQASDKQSDGGQLEEIVITAEKRSESLKDVPSGITALTSERLQTLGVQNFTDYLSYVPSLQLMTAGGSGGLIILRGLNTGLTQLTPTVGFYIDDVAFTPSDPNAVNSVAMPDPDLDDVERVEVLKGPQGTLYGASTLGGLIRVISKRPDLSEVSGDVRLDGAAVDGGGKGGGLRASVNLPLVTDQLALRLTAFDRKDPGYVDNIKTGQQNVNTRRADGGNLALRWAPSDQLDVEMNGFVQESRYADNGAEFINTTTSQPLFGPYKYSSYFNDSSDVKSAAGSLTVSYRLNAGTITNSTSYAHYRGTIVYDNSQLFSPLLAFSADPNAAVRQPAVPTMNKFTEELRYNSNRIGPVELLGGLFFTHEQVGYFSCYCGADGLTGAPLAPPLTNIATINTTSTYREYAVYGNATWHFTDRFDGTVGMRYSTNTQSAKSILSGFLVDGASITTTGNPTQSDESYLFDLRWRPTDHLSTYIRAASAYRPGGPQLGGVPGVQSSFGPDTVWDYEGGAKGLWLEGRLSADADVYYIKWRNIQLNEVVDGLTLLGNGGVAHSEGVELQGQFKATPQLLVGANAAYDKTRIDAISANSAVTGAVVGDPLPFAPQWSGALTADYSFPVAPSVTGALGASYIYQGSRASSFSDSLSTPNVNIPAYSVIDLRARIDWRSFDAVFRVDNVANDHALYSVFTDRLSPTQDIPSFGYRIEPRTYRLSLEERF